MKKMLKRVSALTLVGAMALSTNVFATPVDGLGTPKNLTGDSTVKNPVYAVAVPANFDFTIDPMKILQKDTQIFSDPFLFVNKGNVPIELNIKVTPSLPASGTKPVPKLLDDVLASSADVTKVDKSFALYVAPIITSKLSASGVGAGIALDTATPTDNKFAMPTSYIGVGTSTASLNVVLAASNNFDNEAEEATPGTGWAAPDADEETTFDAFQIVGAVNKNAPWVAADLKVTVSYQFAGMATNDYDDTFLPLDAYQNVTKYTNGPGAFAATPRFRDKVMLRKSTDSGDMTFKVELGSAAVSYLKSLPLASQAALATTLTASALTVTKNGVADTTSIKVSDVSFAVDVAAGPEKGLIGTLTLKAAAADALIADTTYTINGLTLKSIYGTTPPTFVAAANAGTTIIK